MQAWNKTIFSGIFHIIFKTKRSVFKCVFNVFSLPSFTLSSVRRSYQQIIAHSHNSKKTRWLHSSPGGRQPVCKQLQLDLEWLQSLSHRWVKFVNNSCLIYKCRQTANMESDGVGLCRRAKFIYDTLLCNRILDSNGFHLIISCLYSHIKARSFCTSIAVV